MHIDHSVTLLTLSCVCNIATKYSAPILYYDQERYEYEDSLIRGERPRSRSEKSDNNYPQEYPHLIRVQPLNFRLPNIPTQPPEFANPKVLNISARLDSTVVLPCRVTNLGIVSVSWLRAPQLTVLSSGSYMFSSSSRMSLLHDEGSPDYNLQISRVKSTDAGQYLCQLNTQPTQSARVNLITVKDPPRWRNGHASDMVPALALQADISGEKTMAKTDILAPDMVKMTEGGTVTLECVVTEHDRPPENIIWHILGEPLDFLLHRGGIYIQKNYKTRSSSSKLTITRLQVSDTGEYTCAPSGLKNKTVFLEVQQVKPRRSFNSMPENSSISFSLQSRLQGYLSLLASLTLAAVV